MKQVFLSGSGQIEVMEAPIPSRVKDGILVQNAFSLISTGTESSAVVKNKGAMAIYEKLWNSKDRFDQVWDMVKKQGLKSTFNLIQSKVTDHNMIGYSSAGMVIEVDNSDLPFKPGDLVSCMGVGFANHANFITVPKNLAITIPKGVSLEEASYGSIACIALQGIRRLELQAGERIGVIGLGLIGQICVRLLSAMGYEVFGIDLSKERANKANEVNGVLSWSLLEENTEERIKNITQGNGLDGVVICASSSSNEPINMAFDICRQRGRVSVIGDVGLDLQRSKMYKKEIEVRMSCSYGPGRYDYDYEIKGQDYPFGHVRWTEKRNLEYILHLLSVRKIDLKPLISSIYGIDKATEAYTAIKDGTPETFGVLLDYGDIPKSKISISPSERILKYDKINDISDNNSTVKVGLIGVGGYAKSIHIPNLLKMKDSFEIYGVASKTGSTAALAARKTGATIATSDYTALLEDKNVDAVIISTRHSNHAEIVLNSLDAGKHVFIEKPMATTIDDAKLIVNKVEETGLVLRVGFNRRFSPYMKSMKQIIGDKGIRMFTIRVNIGQIQNDWSNTYQEGGRLLGEGVHFFDLCNWFMDQEPVGIYTNVAGSIDITNPNVMVNILYPDGSTAQVCYTTQGNQKAGKEYYEAFGNGKTVVVNDFINLKAYGRNNSVKLKKGDKGQMEQMKEFAKAIKGECPTPIGADALAGYLSTWMAVSAYKSAETNTRIEY